MYCSFGWFPIINYSIMIFLHTDRKICNLVQISYRPVNLVARLNLGTLQSTGRAESSVVAQSAIWEPVPVRPECGSLTTLALHWRRCQPRQGRWPKLSSGRSRMIVLCCCAERTRASLRLFTELHDSVDCATSLHCGKTI